MDSTSAGTLSPAPIRTWTAAARVLGMTDDTLCTHRKAHGDRTVRPWFRDAEAVITWYTAMIAPPERPVRSRRVTARPAGGALDVRALIRDLTGGDR